MFVSGIKGVRVYLKNKLKALDELHEILGLPHNLSLYPKSLVAAIPAELFYDVGFNGGRIAVDCFGRFDNPIVIFLHGSFATLFTEYGCCEGFVNCYRWRANPTFLEVHCAKACY